MNQCSWFDNWFERFWNIYTPKLCQSKGASFEVAKAKYKTKIKSEKKADEILKTLIEQVRYKLKLKEANEHQSQWVMPGILVYLNQQRWEGVTIGNHSDIEKKTSTAKCACGQAVDYAYSGRCSKCEGNHHRAQHRQEIAETLKKQGVYVPGMGREELVKKCKEILSRKKLTDFKQLN